MMDITRRTVLKAAAFGALAVGTGAQRAFGQVGAGAAIEPTDRVFIANEDSNTISVIDPRTNTVDTTINLTSFDEDPRPPFRFVTGGALPTHGAMIHKPLYHGAIDIQRRPSPDGKFLATAGAGRAISV
jgi:YVTN family beta-propeller protein